MDAVSIFALGGLAGMSLTGAVMQIVSLNPARKLIDKLNDENWRQVSTIACWQAAYDRVAEEAEVNGRDVVSLLAENRRLKRADQPRDHGKFAPKIVRAA